MKKLLRIVIAIILPILLVTLFMFGNRPKSTYRPGDIWSYRTRLGEESSRVLIGKSGKDKNGKKIVFIEITGLGPGDPPIPEKSTRGQSFFITEEALNSSLVALEGHGREVPSPLSMYDFSSTGLVAEGVYVHRGQSLAEVLKSTSSPK